MSATVVILPIIRVERTGEGEARFTIAYSIEPKLHKVLTRLADKYWHGDVALCASDLLQTAIVSHSGRRK